MVDGLSLGAHDIRWPLRDVIVLQQHHAALRHCTRGGKQWHCLCNDRLCRIFLILWCIERASGKDLAVLFSNSFYPHVVAYHHDRYTSGGARSRRPRGTTAGEHFARTAHMILICPIGCLI